MTEQATVHDDLVIGTQRGASQMATVELPADQEPTLLEEAARRLRGARGHRRTLVTGGDPDAVYPVPAAAQFVNELGDPCEYLHAGDLEEIANALLQD